jgi:hypothetical protein
MKVSVALTTLIEYVNRSGAGYGGLDIGVTECMYRSGAVCEGLDKGVRNVCIEAVRVVVA